MSTGKQYLLSFTTLFLTKKGYVLYFNRHKNVLNVDQFPQSFEPWNRYDALVLSDTKQGTKVKRASGIFSQQASYRTIFEGLNPKDLEKGSSVYLANLNENLNKAKMESREGAAPNEIEGGDFYNLLGQVMDDVNAKVIQAADVPSQFSGLRKIMVDGEELPPIEESEVTVYGEQLKQDLLNLLSQEGEEKALELLRLLPQQGYNQATELVDLVFKNAEVETKPSAHDRIMVIQYGEKVVDMAKANYVKVVLDSLMDLFTNGKKVEVVTLNGTLDKLDVVQVVGLGFLDEFENTSNVKYKTEIVRLEDVQKTLHAPQANIDILSDSINLKKSIEQVGVDGGQAVVNRSDQPLEFTTYETLTYQDGEISQAEGTNIVKKGGHYENHVESKRTFQGEDVLGVSDSTLNSEGYGGDMDRPDSGSATTLYGTVTGGDVGEESKEGEVSTQEHGDSSNTYGTVSDLDKAGVWVSADKDLTYEKGESVKTTDTSDDQAAGTMVKLSDVAKESETAVSNLVGMLEGGHDKSEVIKQGEIAGRSEESDKTDYGNIDETSESKSLRGMDIQTLIDSVSTITQYVVDVSGVDISNVKMDARLLADHSLSVPFFTANEESKLDKSDHNTSLEFSIVGLDAPAVVSLGVDSGIDDSRSVSYGDNSEFETNSGSTTAYADLGDIEGSLAAVRQSQYEESSTAQVRLAAVLTDKPELSDTVVYGKEQEEQELAELLKYGENSKLSSAESAILVEGTNDEIESMEVIGVGASSQLDSTTLRLILEGLLSDAVDGNVQVGAELDVLESSNSSVYVQGSIDLFSDTTNIRSVEVTEYDTPNNIVREGQVLDHETLDTQPVHHSNLLEYDMSNESIKFGGDVKFDFGTFGAFFGNILSGDTTNSGLVKEGKTEDTVMVSSNRSLLGVVISQVASRSGVQRIAELDLSNGAEFRKHYQAEITDLSVSDTFNVGDKPFEGDGGKYSNTYYAEVSHSESVRQTLGGEGSMLAIEGIEFDDVKDVELHWNDIVNRPDREYDVSFEETDTSVYKPNILDIQLTLTDKGDYIPQILDVAVEVDDVGDRLEKFIDTAVEVTGLGKLLDNLQDVLMESVESGSVDEHVFDSLLHGVEVFDMIESMYEVAANDEELANLNAVMPDVTVESPELASKEETLYDTVVELPSVGDRQESEYDVQMELPDQADTIASMFDVQVEVTEYGDVSDKGMDVYVEIEEKATMKGNTVDVEVKSHENAISTGTEKDVVLDVTDEGLATSEFDIAIENADAAKNENMSDEVVVDITDVAETSRMDEVVLETVNVGENGRTSDVVVEDTVNTGVGRSSYDVAVDGWSVADTDSTIDVGLEVVDQAEVGGADEEVKLEVIEFSSDVGNVEDVVISSHESAGRESIEDISIEVHSVANSIKNFDVALARGNYATFDKDVDVVIEVSDEGAVEGDHNVTLEDYSTATTENMSEVTLTTIETGGIDTTSDVTIETIALADTESSADVVVDSVSLAEMEEMADVVIEGHEGSTSQGQSDVVLEDHDMANLGGMSDVEIDGIATATTESSTDVVVEYGDTAATERTDEIILEHYGYATSETLEEVVIDTFDSADSETVEEVTLEHVDTADSQRDVDVIIEGMSNADSDTSTDVVLEHGDMAGSERTTDVTLDQFDMADSETTSDVVVEHFDMADSERTTDVVIEFGDKADSERTQDVFVETGNMADIERDVDVTIEGIENAVSDSKADIELEEFDMATQDSTTEVTVEVGDVADVRNDYDTVVEDFDFADTRSTVDVAVEEGDLATNEQTHEVLIEESVQAVSETFSDVIIEEFDPATRGRGRLIDIIKEEESDNGGTTLITIEEEEESLPTGHDLIDIYEEEEVTLGGSTIMIVDEEEQAEPTSTSYMTIEDENLADRVNSSLGVIEDDEEVDRKKSYHVSIQDEEEGLLGRSFHIDVDDEDRGSITSREFPADIDDDDDLGVGQQPVDPPWEEEPEKKGKMWLIMGKNYPAWNGWNPKKTR